MPHKVTCPNGHAMLVRDEHVGKRVKCPTCTEGFVAPAPMAWVEAPAPPPPPTKPSPAPLPRALPDPQPMPSSAQKTPPQAPAPAKPPSRRQESATATPTPRPRAQLANKGQDAAPLRGPDPSPEWLATLEMARNPGSSVLDAHPLIIWPVTLAALFFLCAGGGALLYVTLPLPFRQPSPSFAKNDDKASPTSTLAPAPKEREKSTQAAPPPSATPPTTRTPDPAPNRSPTNSPAPSTPPPRDVAPPEPTKSRPPASRDLIAQAIDDLGTADFDKRKQTLDSLTDVEPSGRRADVVHAIEKVMADDDPLLREAALKAYVIWAEPDQCLDKLLNLLSSNERRVREIAIRGLGKLQNDRAIAPLARQLGTPDDRREASKALQAMGSKAEKEVVARLGDPDNEVRMEACRILKVIGTHSSVAKLREVATETSDDLLKRWAKDAIAAIEARS